MSAASLHDDIPSSRPAPHRPIPVGVQVLSTILFGAFAVGGVTMQVATGVPSVITSAIEAIILLFFLAASTLTRFQIVWKAKP